MIDVKAPRLRVSVWAIGLASCAAALLLGPPRAQAQQCSSQVVPNAFTPLSAPNVLTTSVDDTPRENVALPFTHNFYDNNFSDLTLDPNGVVAMGAGRTDTSLTNSEPGNLGGPEDFIAPFWDDLKLFPANAGHIGVQEEGVAPNRTFTVEYLNYSRFNDASATFSFQVRFFEGSRRIEVDYGTFSGTDVITATMGLENSDATEFLLFAPSGCTNNCSETDFRSMSNMRVIVTCLCGNGAPDPGEQCDDGNNAGGDGCGPSCQLEFCGNGLIDGGEVCDDGNMMDGDGCSADCFSDETCGNGSVDGAVGESCDDGNTTAGDGCSGTCRLEFCGNGTVDPPNEVCDDSGTMGGDGCSADCLSDETCGNGVIDTSVGEACDDGNTMDGDACPSTCALATCGDGVVDPGEICDDGNTVDGDGCNTLCSSDETCGNSVVDLAIGEQCDDGNTAGLDGCSATCRLEFCGNGAVESPEVCDDGNNSNGDGCAAGCDSDETCGNGVTDSPLGESCDDGNTADGDGCSAICGLEFCGNGVADAGEICDDGNNLAGDGCGPGCMSDESCGNGVVDAAVGEACDDGNTVDGDGCQSNCALPNCGDGVLEGDEVCDDGNNISGDGCNEMCTSDETCGNTVVDLTTEEQCDDGNNTDGDGCSAVCGLEFCGNGVVDGAEVCDDGNNTDGDGCAAGCNSDETCGNGVTDPRLGEGCDDGNTDDGDGCSATCGLEFCGNGVVDDGETCDDGNNLAGDGCGPGCMSDESCGNGVVDAATGEACDDGNNVDGDGCQANCALPDCGDGVTDDGEACDDGNNTSGDGCNGTCTSTESCGNSIVDTGEQCDAGDANSDTEADACRTSCMTAICGDGAVDSGEECDDGAENGPMGMCSARCAEPTVVGPTGAGCGCRVGSGETPAGVMLGLLGLLGLLWVRRRWR